MMSMIPTQFPIGVVWQRLDNGFVLAEGLGFPEVSRLGAGRRSVDVALRYNLRRLIVAEPLAALYRRFAGGEPVIAAVTVPLEPPGPGAGWREMLPLSFPVVAWDHGGAALAFMPALGIEVLASSSATSSCNDAHGLQ